MSLRATLAESRADLAAGLSRHPVWVALATEDIGDQHRRTALGPLWLMVNYLAFAGTFIFIFHRGDATGPGYAVYVATGLLAFFYMQETISISVTLFAREASFIKGTNLPLSVYVFRAALQSMIRAGYALVGCVLILLVAGAVPSLVWAWSLLGAALILLTTPAVIICFAFLGIYLPDSQFVVSNLMRVAMFITPVFWRDPGGDGFRQLVHDYNPLTWFLEIVRAPVVDGVVPLGALALCGAISLCFWTLALLLLGSLRRQVPLVV